MYLLFYVQSQFTVEATPAVALEGMANWQGVPLGRRCQMWLVPDPVFMTRLKVGCRARFQSVLEQLPPCATVPWNQSNVSWEGACTGSLQLLLLASSKRMQTDPLLSALELLGVHRNRHTPIWGGKKSSTGTFCNFWLVCPWSLFLDLSIHKWSHYEN